MKQKLMSTKLVFNKINEVKGPNYLALRGDFVIYNKEKKYNCKTAILKIDFIRLLEILLRKLLYTQTCLETYILF